MKGITTKSNECLVSYNKHKSVEHFDINLLERYNTKHFKGYTQETDKISQS